MAKPYLLAALSVPFAWCGVVTSAQADELQNPPIEIAVTFFSSWRLGEESGRR